MLPAVAAAQRIDSAEYLLGEVRVVDTTLTRNKKSFLSLSNTTAAANLADLFSAQSSLFIKSYGPGMLSSISLRGTGAAHTPILWNGFNMQSPMSGQLDLSLLPTSFFDEVVLHKGSMATQRGSGAIGGIIDLNTTGNNTLPFAAEVEQRAGSFGLNSQLVKLQLAKNHWNGNVRAFRSNVKNNFPYRNYTRFGQPEETLPNAQVAQQGILGQVNWQKDSRNLFSISAWYQNNERQIPPTLLTPASAAFQQDESTRLTAVYTYNGRQHRWIARTAFFDEKLWYTDIPFDLRSRNQAKASISEVENFLRTGKRSNLHSGINYTYYTATASTATGGGGYGQIHPQQSRVALYANYTLDSLLRKKTARITAGLRGEEVDGKFVPLIYSLQSDWKMHRKWTLHAAASRVYRVPNFNDRYWQPGGNPDIQPELGYNGHASLLFRQQLRSTVIAEAQLTFFANRIQNWILWLPQNGIWTPQNLAEVFSRGIEWQLKCSGNSGKLYWHFNADGTYTVAQNIREKTPGDASVGKQLFYVPYIKQVAQLACSYNSWEGFVQGNYTDMRYTSSDNTSSLPAFITSNIGLGRLFSLRNGYALKTSGKLNNIFNTYYEVMEYRPMPGIHFEISVALTYKKEKKQP